MSAGLRGAASSAPIGAASAMMNGAIPSQYFMIGTLHLPEEQPRCHESRRSHCRSSARHRPHGRLYAFGHGRGPELQVLQGTVTTSRAVRVISGLPDSLPGESPRQMIALGGAAAAAYARFDAHC